MTDNVPRLFLRILRGEIVYDPQMVVDGDHASWLCAEDPRAWKEIE